VGIPERLKALRDWEHPEIPELGDLVNVTIEHLEPVPDTSGRMHTISKRYLRGKLGSLSTLPQIERRIGSMKRGESALLRVHFPAHYELETIRNQTRVMRISLLDCKRFRFAPVIEGELFYDPKTLRYIDSTGMTESQVLELLDER
jgi:FKBP-type peptidyl-prolyl cis-trans isomerase (trigger factor)